MFSSLEITSLLLKPILNKTYLLLLLYLHWASCLFFSSNICLSLLSLYNHSQAGWWPLSLSTLLANSILMGFISGLKLHSCSSGALVGVFVLVDIGGLSLKNQNLMKDMTYFYSVCWRHSTLLTLHPFLYFCSKIIILLTSTIGVNVQSSSWVFLCVKYLFLLWYLCTFLAVRF